jgi:DNA topoisomerase-2
MSLRPAIFISVFFLAERPKYTFDFSEEEDDDAAAADDSNDLEELKVKASPITNDGEDEFVPSDGLDKDEYAFSSGKSKATPE